MFIMTEQMGKEQISDTFARLFLNASKQGLSAYEQAVTAAKDTIINAHKGRSQPYTGLDCKMQPQMLEQFSICPEEEKELKDVLTDIQDTVLEHSVFVSNPSCLAHLHSPVVVPALAAEMLISAMNQSMDSWDQSPAATYLEVRLVKWLCSLFGYSKQADGVFTSGGTESNYMGLMLARDSWCWNHLHWNVKKYGLPKEAGRLRILCSKHAHFTVQKSAAQLGLGSEAVIPLETDRYFRISPEDLNRKLDELDRQNLLPFAIVATAGTTDFGSIDPLSKLAEAAEQNDIWFHVDAAYGGALALSDKHHWKIGGIEKADSMAVDFHKLFYQPINCGAFLLKDAYHFAWVRWNADYLNPEEDDCEGTINLVGKSLQTTRRFDTLKLFTTLQTLGKRNLSDMIERTIKLAKQTAILISSYPYLEGLNEPEIGVVVFRYCPQTSQQHTDSLYWVNYINETIRRSFLSEGKTVFAKTKVEGKAYLKFTILNPNLTMDRIEQILSDIQSLGEEIEQKEGRVLVHVRG